MAEKVVRGLLVEDDPNDAELFHLQMERDAERSPRFEFERAEDLRGALKMLAKGGFDVVLLDMMLPDSRGVETIQRLRARFPDVPVVVLTGLSEEAVGIEALRNGAQDYQVKGDIDGRALRRTISFAVERHRLLNRMGNIIEKSLDGMVVVDAAGKVRHTNTAATALLGRKADELLGKPFPLPLPAERSVELKIPCDSGEKIAELRVSEIDWDDEPARLVMLRDITELRRVEQLKAEVKERRRMDKLKDELIGTVSHEMRNPLAVIKAATHGLQESFNGEFSKQQADMLSIETRNIRRLERIVERILDLSRLESGKAIIRSQRVEAGVLIIETVKGFQLVNGQKKVTIKADLPKDLPALRADPELLVQVLTNLVDNAVRFAKTRIVVEAREAEENPGYVRISVVDDGQGIPKARLGDMFDKFVQVSRSTSGGGYKGTGLGLAICKEMVERMRGSIWVESVEGHGASFHILLPRDAGGPAEVSAAPSRGGDKSLTPRP